MSWPDMSFMRSEVSKAYSGDKWKQKVRAMADRQVIALYLSLKEKGQLGRKPANYVEEPCYFESDDSDSKQKYDPLERFNDESDRDYYDRIHHEL